MNYGALYVSEWIISDQGSWFVVALLDIWFNVDQILLGNQKRVYA